MPAVAVNKRNTRSLSLTTDQTLEDALCSNVLTEPVAMVLKKSRPDDS